MYLWSYLARYNDEFLFIYMFFLASLMLGLFSSMSTTFDYYLIYNDAKRDHPHWRRTNKTSVYCCCLYKFESTKINAREFVVQVDVWPIPRCFWIYHKSIRLTLQHLRECPSRNCSEFSLPGVFSFEAEFFSNWNCWSELPYSAWWLYVPCQRIRWNMQART